MHEKLEQAAERRGEKGGQAVAGRKAAVLAELMQLTTPRQMRWIVQIILGNPKARLHALCGVHSVLYGPGSDSMAASHPHHAGGSLFTARLLLAAALKTCACS